jgi:hypothetical protein
MQLHAYQDHLTSLGGPGPLQELSLVSKFDTKLAQETEARPQACFLNGRQALLLPEVMGE